MKTTINAVLINLNSEQESLLNHLQALFSSAIRFAYQRLLESQEKKGHPEDDSEQIRTQLEVCQ